MGWTFKLTDIATDQVLADLTNITLAAKISPRLNRSLGIELTLPADELVLQTRYVDGDPNLFPGTRAIRAYQDNVLRGHTIIVNCSWSGETEHDQKVVVSSLDPLFLLNMRMIYDDDGSLADPKFKSPITAATMMRKVIRNSTFYDEKVINGVVPLPLPIEVETGSFTGGTDMGEFFTDGPQTIGDLVTTLTDTGAVDIVLKPVETAMNYTPGIMAQMNVSASWGTPRLATFAYDTGTIADNVSAARRTLGVETLANRITYELGPKIGKSKWKSNITATGPNIPASYLALSLASRKKFGVYHQIRVYDTEADAGSRPLYMALWKTELLLRSNPRDLLYFTPAAHGDNSVYPEGSYRPFIDYDIGDLIHVQAGPSLGPPFKKALQRVYGFDVDIDDMGVERVSEIIASADAE